MRLLSSFSAKWGGGVKRAGVSLLLAAMYLSPAAASNGPASRVTMPELPRLTVDTAYVPSHGKTLVVRKGGNFQAALDAARPGEVIALEPGATFTGPFRLPVKPGADWIIVRSGAPDGRLPPPGQRVDPSYARFMPKLVAASGPVITTAPGAHHYRFIGIEIRPAREDESARRGALRFMWRAAAGREADAENERFLQTLVSLDAAGTSVERLPHHIIFDRCYLHGDAKHGMRRGIAMNSRYTAVVDSYLSDFKTVGEDSQAIAGWNGPGPFKIENNYLEGAGENVMFGGADPSIPDLVPADVEIRGNRFVKPLSWKVGDPTYEGTPWTIKNLLELKNARRVLIDGNLFEYSWQQAQGGFAVLMTVRNQDGAAPWSTVEDVTFTNNVLRHIGGGVNILGRDDNHPSRRTRRILIKNNLFDDVGGAWGGGQLFQLLDGTADVAIEHNTALQTGSILQGGDHEAHRGFVFTDNIVLHNAYGIIGSGSGVGYPSLDLYFPDAIVRRNVIVGGPSDLYPRGNFFPRSLDNVDFVNRADGDYRLKRSSPYKDAATDGGDLGVDFKTLCMPLPAVGRVVASFPFCRLSRG